MMTLPPATKDANGNWVQPLSETFCLKLGLDFGSRIVWTIDDSGEVTVRKESPAYALAWNEYESYVTPSYFIHDEMYHTITVPAPKMTDLQRFLYDHSVDSWCEAFDAHSRQQVLREKFYTALAKTLSFLLDQTR